MKPIYVTVMACALMVLASCSNSNSRSSSPENEAVEQHSEEVELTSGQMKTVGITVGTVDKKVLGSVVRANGELRLNPQDMADVTSLMGGIVRKIGVVEGQAVRAGQPVAYIENTEIVEMQKNYLVAAKETEMAQVEMQRQKTLSAQGAGIEKTRQQAEAAYATAKARQMGLYHQLAQVGISPGAVEAGKIVSQIPVRAAISGTVGKINVSMGSFVDTSSSLMQIANNAAVYASLNVFERNLAQVRVGQSVDLVVTNSPGLRISGKVFRINRAIDPQIKSVAVHVRIAGDGASGLMAGMYVSGVIQAGQQLVTALPDGAIAEAEGKKYVFVLEGKHKEGDEEKFRFRRVEVITGASELGCTQVDFVEPVAADATVVTANAFYLASMAADHGEH